MADVVPLRPYTDVALILRQLADEITSGNLQAPACTIVIGHNIYILGAIVDNELAVRNAHFELCAAADRLVEDYNYDEEVIR